MAASAAEPAPTGLDFPAPSVASPRPARTVTASSTASSTAKATTTPFLTLSPQSSGSETDTAYIAAIWLAVILTAVTAACVVIYRRYRNRRDESDPIVDGSANK